MSLTHSFFNAIFYTIFVYRQMSFCQNNRISVTDINKKNTTLIIHDFITIRIWQTKSLLSCHGKVVCPLSLYCGFRFQLHADTNS